MPGTVVIESFDSEILADNPLGDPTRRHFPVYLPPGYTTETGRHYPVLLVLQPFGSCALGVENASIWGWGERLSDRLDRLIESGRCQPVIAVAPECATRYGGSQYLNSAGTGRYADYLIEEVIPFVDRRFRTIDAASGRALVGRSSGGYGGLVLAMRYPGTFAAIASHAGDMGFEYAYLPDFPKVVGGVGDPPDPAAFIERFLAAPKKASRDFPVMNILAMASCYSPNPSTELGFDLPFDLVTGAIDPIVWDRWLSHDPLRMVDKLADALRELKLVLFDCGRRDNFNLHLGARRLSRRLDELGVEHQYDEFDDDHFGLAYRYDESIPKLAAALS